MSAHFDDHQSAPTGPRRSWGYTAEGPGRWCLMDHPLGQHAGMLFVTDADDAVGFLPNGEPNGHSLNTSIAEGIQEAVKSGTSSPSIVFDAWAARVTVSIAAQQVQHAEDLGPVADQYSANGEASLAEPEA